MYDWQSKDLRNQYICLWVQEILLFQSEKRSSKILGKSAGQEVSMVIELCKHDYVLNKDFVDYLETDANAYTFFKKLSGSHQRYFQNGSIRRKRHKHE